MPPFAPETKTKFSSPGLIHLEVIPLWTSRDPESTRIPQRDPRATEAQLDLSSHYNVGLRQAESQSDRENSLSGLPAGLQILAGVTFDARGIIRLAGDEVLAASMPARANHIPVAQSCQRLHFLHATGRPTAAGNVIGKYLVHYANGTILTIPIVYGYALRDWWVKEGEPPAPKGLELAWSGSNAEAAANGTTIRLFKWTWENPLPEIEIRSLDFVSALTGCAPFLVAVTAEP